MSNIEVLESSVSWNTELKEPTVIAFKRVLEQIDKFTNRIFETMKKTEYHNPRLARVYRHTKKLRTRKKYARLILASYREEARNASHDLG